MEVLAIYLFADTSNLVSTALTSRAEANAFAPSSPTPLASLLRTSGGQGMVRRWSGDGQGTVRGWSADGQGRRTHSNEVSTALNSRHLAMTTAEVDPRNLPERLRLATGSVPVSCLMGLISTPGAFMLT